QALAVGDIDDGAEHAAASRRLADLPRVGQPALDTVGADDPVIGGRGFASLQGPLEMRTHPLAIVGMNERRPFGAFHLAIARPKASCVMMIDSITKTPNFRPSWRCHLGPAAIVRIAGATIRAPSASPNHQSNHTGVNRGQG